MDPLAITQGESVISNSAANDAAGAATKKKRKSSAEKFLEDNSDYYQIKVLYINIFYDITIKQLFRFIPFTQKPFFMFDWKVLRNLASK